MKFTETLKEIDRLHGVILNLGKIPENVLRNINYKFRLEWNYYSNRMEGNTLTIDETKSVMVGNIRVNDKPLKDVMEMRGHDDVITEIINIGKGELNISESRIRRLHEAIMYEEDKGKKDQVGQWKKINNHVINYKGEKFDFAQAEDVPHQMHELINWLNTEKEKIQRGAKTALHPVLFAFMFHLRYLTIHPFYDGNGRTGRILTNLILISYGFPPFYIKENEKATYYRYLAEVQGYGANEEFLYNELAICLIRSMQIVIDATEGKSIEEPDDIDKEIELFKRQINKSNERKEIRSWENIKSIIHHSAVPLFTRLRQKLSVFDELFQSSENRILFSTENSSEYSIKTKSGGYTLSTTKFPDPLLDNWLNTEPIYGEPRKFGLEYSLKGYKMGYPFNVAVMVSFVFDEYTYHVTRSATFSDDNHYMERNYDEQLSEEDIIFTVKSVARELIDHIRMGGNL